MNTGAAGQGDAADDIRLPRVTCRLHFLVPDGARFPGYTGSLWRGQFGARLRRQVCITGAPRCTGCEYRLQCPYGVLFESVPDPRVPLLPRYPHVPHPLVLAPPARLGPQHWRPGQHYSLTVHLFGGPARWLPLVVRVLAQVGAAGLGRARHPLRLERIGLETAAARQELPWHERQVPLLEPAVDPVPPCPDGPVELRFLTPLRLVAGGRLAGPDRLDFHALYASLLRRISVLSAAHAQRPLQADFAGLVARSRRIDLDRQHLRWHDWHRHSSRQRRTVPMGGVVGRTRLQLDGHRELWPCLWLGQWTHAGKGTIMGLGRYRIHSCPPSS